MEIVFGNKNLEELYLKGKNRKYPYAPEVIEKFIETVHKMINCTQITDYFQHPSLRFKKYEDGYSVRLNRVFRVEFLIAFAEDNQTIEKIIITELSNHYGD